jgi:hypothetical protein
MQSWLSRDMAAGLATQQAHCNQHFVLLLLVVGSTHRTLVSKAVVGDVAGCW